MAKRYFSHCCDDAECMFCQSDDADAAFWDEFFYQLDDSEETAQAEVQVISDEDTYDFDLTEDEMYPLNPITIKGD